MPKGELTAPGSEPRLTGGTTLALSAACGFTVANVYINNPLLAEIAREFGVSEQHAGLVATASQIGYVLGILFIVPLGDVIPVRRLVTALLAIVACALAAASAAPSMALLYAAQCLISASTVVPQILMPFAASLAPPGQQARVLGRVQAGLASGIVLARAVAGIVCTQFGWRAAYAVAAPIMLGLLLVLPRRLPLREPTAPVRYRELIVSLGRLFLSEPALRLSGLLGGCVFGAFSAFWTTLAFFLERPPYEMGPTGVGLIAVLSVAGTIGPAFVTGIADRYGTRFANAIGIACALVGWATLWTLGGNWWCLLAGINLVSAGSTFNQIANQTRIFALLPEARSRLNTVYMVCTFSGGALGAWLGTLAWTLFGWNGVCGVSTALILVAAAALAAGAGESKKR